MRRNRSPPDLWHLHMPSGDLWIAGVAEMGMMMKKVKTMMNLKVC